MKERDFVSTYNGTNCINNVLSLRTVEIPRNERVTITWSRSFSWPIVTIAWLIYVQESTFLLWIKCSIRCYFKLVLSCPACSDSRNSGFRNIGLYWCILFVTARKLNFVKTLLMFSEEYYMRPLACWDPGFESHWGHGCLSVVSCVLSGRGLCDELVTRPEESYRLWCVVVCDLETSRNRRTWPALVRKEKRKKNCVSLCLLLLWIGKLLSH
jgi:hypothetical protein